jgi:two-component system phosphate regulon response regulator OmpR
VSDAARILVVDDDASIRAMLVEYLGVQGFAVAEAATGQELRDAVARNPPDVVLLDLRLGREDGLGLARWLRERSDVGIIMVTGAGEVVDRIVGLEIGADDYVAKPFDPRELLARIKSVLRRLQGRRSVPVAEAETRAFVAVGACRLDLAARQLFDGGDREVELTAMEFELLRVFVENPGKALSRDRLLMLTRNREGDPYDRSIDNRIARLRRKVEADPDRPSLIRTVRSVGYMYTPAAAVSPTRNES